MPDERMLLLPNLGVLCIEGPDATHFLQGQVTADLRGLAPGASTLAALCSPQGRVVALPRLIGTADGLLAVLPADLTATVAARLARFILRAKVKIEDASQTLSVAFTLDPATAAGAGPATVTALGHGRQLLVGPAAALAAAAGATTGAGAWETLAVAAGEPEVYAPTSEAWVPQMLNLDLLGAVSFSKGCYTGQEIVARTQHLGRIKRRMFRYAVGDGFAAAPGAGLFRDGAKVGEVVRAATGPATLLAVVNLDAAGLALSDESGVALCQPEPLPYAVPETAAVA